MLRTSRSLASVLLRKQSSSFHLHPKRSNSSGGDDSKKDALFAVLLPDTTVVERLATRKSKKQSKQSTLITRKTSIAQQTKTRLLDSKNADGITKKGHPDASRKSSRGATKHNLLKLPKPARSIFRDLDTFLVDQEDGAESLKVSSSYQAKVPPQVTKRSDDPMKWTTLLPNSGESNLLKRRSILDVFKVDEPPPRNPNSFDEEAFQAFNEVLDDYFRNKTQRPPKKAEKIWDAELKEDVERWIKLDQPEVDVQLPLLSEICQEGTETKKGESNRTLLKTQVMSELQAQAEMFRKELCWNDQQYSYAMKSIYDVAKLAAKKHKALPVIIIWEKSKEAGCLEESIIAECLRASSSFSGGVLSRNRSPLLKLPGNLHDILDQNQKNGKLVAAGDEKLIRDANVPEQLAAANDLLYEPTHQSIAIRTRRLINVGNADQALELTEANMEGENKLRAYPQIFSLYLQIGNIDSAMHLFEKMKKEHDTVPVEPEFFVQLIASLAEKGYFCQGSAPSSAAAALGYSPASGPSLFDQMAQEMKEIIGSISSASAKRLQKAFKQAFDVDWSPPPDTHVSALAPLKPLDQSLVQDDVLIADRVSINSSSGLCTCSGATLRLIGLEPHQCTLMKKSLIGLVGNQKGRDALVAFWGWLETRTGQPFTAIVDGANVAYYMQNFDTGGFNFHQIKFTVSALERLGERPLVVLPWKYQEDSFPVTLGTTTKVQTSSRADKSILRALKKNGKLYVVPQGCLDDYFWMLASLSGQSSCEDLHAEGSLSGGATRRWPGSRPCVITNDQVRDHQQFELLEPKLFNRWYSSTIVNYNFTGFVKNDVVDRDVVFSPADLYSREMQRNVTPSTSGNTTDAFCWHFPVDGWSSSDWFCIRLPSTKHDK